MSVLLVPAVGCPRSRSTLSTRAVAAAKCIVIAMLGFSSISSTAFAQEAPVKVAEAEGNPQPNNFVSALDLIPQTAAGLVRIPNLPDVCNAAPKTHFGMLFEDAAVQPFIEAQRDRAEKYIDSMETTLGLRPQDLYDIASGEVVAAWLPFEKDQRRPYSLCIVADIRGRRVLADQTMATIDADFKAGNATRVDAKHRGQEVRVYTTKPKPGQLKIEQVAITLNDDRIIAADRDTVVFDLLDAIEGQPKDTTINTVEDYKAVMKQSRDSLAQVDNKSAVEAVHWFARPFPMARILRKSLHVDRGNQVDILNLLENQGFDAVKAAGGVVVIAGDKFDMLHRGFILAPPTAPLPKRFAKAAEMLQLNNVPLEEIPKWIHADAASFMRLHWDITRGFWAAEPLVNEALDDDIFRPMIEGIRDDEEGPQIDIIKDVLPNLDNQIILVTDNTEPASPTSERMLVAIRIKDAQVIGKAIGNAMEVEPDASKLEEVPGVDIWRVERGAGTEEFDAGFLDELGFDEEKKKESAPPLLENWAIAVLEKGSGSDSAYIVFSSHSDLVVQVAKSFQNGAQESFSTQGPVKEIVDAMKALGATSVAVDRVVRTDLAFRTKYELLRQGRLGESDSVLASVVRRIFEKDGEEKGEKVDAAMLPPIQQIQKYLRPGGGYIEQTDTGMTLNGFLLK